MYLGERMHNKSKKTYLFVLPWSLEHAGGVNQVVIDLAREMIKTGSFQPIILIMDWDATSPKWGKYKGLVTIRWRIRPYLKNMSAQKKIFYAVWEYRFCRQFYQFCLDNQVVAINSHYPTPSIFGLSRICTKLELSIPLILSFHGTDLENVKLERDNMVLHQWCDLVSGAEVVVCSKDLGEKAAQIFGSKPNIHVAHNGIDASAFAGMMLPSIPSQKKILLSIGKFTHNKAQDVLIEAFGNISDAYEDVDLYLIGASDEALPNLKKMASLKKLNNRVHFLTDLKHEEVAHFLSIATIFVLPSRREAFPIVLLEAGAFKLPVVASHVGGIPELIQDGVNGRLVAPDNPLDLMECLKFLLDFPVISKGLGVSLHKTVTSSFSWETAHQKYVKLVSTPPNSPCN